MSRFFFIFLTCLHLAFLHGYGSSPVVGAYYENWSQYRPPSGGRAQFLPNLIDPTVITDLYYAFACFGFVSKSIDPGNPRLTGDFSVQPFEWNDQSVLYPQVMALKGKNPHLKVILSIGGWSFNDPSDPNVGAYTFTLFSQMVSTAANRKQFIDSAVAYAHQFGFDGVDIDWEYPGDLTRGGQSDDFANFLAFLKECSETFHSANPPLLLTYASPAVVPAGAPSSYQTNPSLYFQWLAQCSAYLDRLNVMAYDYHGPFDQPKLTGVNAPLNRDTSPSSQLSIAETIRNYIQNGVPSDKIVLGMPTYGHSYAGVSSLSADDSGPGKPFVGPGPAGPSTGSPGLLAYFEIADMAASADLLFGTDSTTSTAYGYSLNRAEWVSFDTPDTISLKAQLAKENQLLGVMLWAIDNDEYQWAPKYPNTRSAFTHFYQPSAEED